jgi:3-hydroxymyristoyl/3-hydroxydecanoyl-(acyl carrier protein) dehydratase
MRRESSFFFSGIVLPNVKLRVSSKVSISRKGGVTGFQLENMVSKKSSS